MEGKLLRGASPLRVPEVGAVDDVLRVAMAGKRRGVDPERPRRGGATGRTETTAPPP
jgi:hypothetical protein